MARSTKAARKHLMHELAEMMEGAWGAMERAAKSRRGLNLSPEQKHALNRRLHDAMLDVFMDRIERGGEEGEGEERSSRPGKRDFHLVCKKKARSRKVTKAGAYANEEKAADKARDLVEKKRGGFGQCEVRFKQGRGKGETVATIGSF